MSVVLSPQARAVVALVRVCASGGSGVTDARPTPSSARPTRGRSRLRTFGAHFPTHILWIPAGAAHPDAPEVQELQQYYKLSPNVITAATKQGTHAVHWEGLRRVWGSALSRL